MNLRTKTFVINATTLISLLSVVYMVGTPLILNGFERVESKDAQQDALRAVDAILEQENSLGSKLSDWSIWDDSYQFVSDLNPDFITSNFGNDSAYESLVFDTIVYVNKAGKIVYSNGAMPVSQDLKNQLKPDSPLLKSRDVRMVADESYNINSLVILNNSIAFISSQPILRTDGAGPSNGTVVFVKYLDDDLQQQIADTTHLDLDIYATTQQDTPDDVIKFASPLENKKTNTVVLSSDTIGSYAAVGGLDGRTTLLLRAVQSRDIFNQGKESVKLFVVLLAVTGLIFLVVSTIFLELLLINRTVRLTKQVGAIDVSSMKPVKVEVKGSDEISVLGHTINTMLNKIKTSNSENNLLVGRLESEKLRFTASIESLPLGFILTDKYDNVLMTNPALEKMLKVTIDSDTDNVKSGDIKSKLIGLTKHVSNRNEVYTHELVSEDGRFLRIVVAPVLTNAGNVEGEVKLIEDVTETRIIERSKDEFFSIASHELRTPLTAIRGNTSMIQTYYAEQLKDPDLNMMVSDIYSSSVRLIDIVNDFLDASSLEQGKMKFDMCEFALDEIIEKVTYEMAGVVDERKLFLKVDTTLGILPKMYGDPNRIKQVIYNLIGNALKFTDEGGVTVKTELISNDNVKVTIIDTGRGINAEGQRLLFRKFQQTNSSLHTRDTTRGTGLGLYISKLIVERLGGQITIDSSEEGVGTAFSFTIPIKANDKAPNEA